MKKSLCFAAFTAGTMLAGTGLAFAQEAPPPADRAPVLPHTVVAGESLSTISLAELGTTDRWAEIFALNRAALASPEVIAVGQVLDVPAPPVAAPPVVPVQEASPPSDQPPVHTHTVAAGESLSKISQSELGTSDRWVEIFTVNRKTIAGPDLLDVGQLLDIPAAPVAIPADLLASLTPAATSVAPPPSGRSASTAGQGAMLTQSVPSSGGGGGNLAAIRACESSGNYGAVSADGLYGGAYQFDSQTWQSVGGSGDPATASPAEQDARAGQLLGQRGASPWPNCG
ncbi:MAG: transglycosylase family protein [Actinomycetota bacterium]|nr:transglycosylase family protein [Actinomycetota bacterium]